MMKALSILASTAVFFATACGARTSLEGVDAGAPSDVSYSDRAIPPVAFACVAAITETNWSECIAVEPTYVEITTNNCVNAAFHPWCGQAALDFWGCVGREGGVCRVTPQDFGWSANIEGIDCQASAEELNQCFLGCRGGHSCSESGRDCTCSEGGLNGGEACTVFPELDPTLPHCGQHCPFCPER